MKNENASKVPEQYFATLPIDEIGTELDSRIEDYYQFLNASNFFSLWFRSYTYFFNSARLSGRVQNVGSKLHLKYIAMDEFPNLARNVHTLVTGSLPSMKTETMNGDVKSIEQSVVAQDSLDYEVIENRVYDYIQQAALDALVFSEGFVYKVFDPSLGEDTTDPTTGLPSKTGGWVFENLLPNDIVRDPNVASYNNLTYIIVRRFVNRWDLIAKYPQHEQAIRQYANQIGNISNLKFGYQYLGEYDDLIPMWEFFHKKTQAVKAGRYTIMLDSDTILFDGPLPFKDIPVYRCAYGEYKNTPFGWSCSFSALPVCEAINGYVSMLMTNTAAFGGIRILNPRGSGLSIASLSETLSLVDYTPVTSGAQALKPEGLNMQNPMDQETFKFLDLLMSKAETYFGVNAVLRGQENKELSGSALALIASTSLQFNAGFQNSVIKLVENIGTGMVQDIKMFANAPRTAVVVGKENQGYMQSYTKDDFNSINRVIVSAGNPILNSPAGKANLADQLAQHGYLPSGELGAMKYIEVLNEGRIEPVTHSLQAQYIQIQSDKEMILGGQMPLIQMTDNHPLLASEINALNNNPQVRQDPQLGQLVRQYVLNHYQMWKTMDPTLCAFLGIQPPPAPGVPPPGNQPPPPGGHGPVPPHQGPPPASAPHPMAGQPPVNPIANAGGQVNMPHAPNMPAKAPPQLTQHLGTIQTNIAQNLGR